jgi:hypothetical protein
MPRNSETIPAGFFVNLSFQKLTKQNRWVNHTVFCCQDGFLNHPTSVLKKSITDDFLQSRFESVDPFPHPQ